MVTSKSASVKKNEPDLLWEILPSWQGSEGSPSPETRPTSPTASSSQAPALLETGRAGCVQGGMSPPAGPPPRSGGGDAQLRHPTPAGSERGPQDEPRGACSGAGYGVPAPSWGCGDGGPAGTRGAESPGLGGNLGEQPAQQKGQGTL